MRLSKLTTAVAGFLMAVMFVSTVSAFEIITEKDIKLKIVKTNHLIKTADNFIVLFDASGSMGEDFKEGVSKLDAEVQILRQQNAILPNLGYKAGLYLFTPFKAYYEMGDYDKEAFSRAIDSLPNTKTAGNFVGQPAPLAVGIRKLSPILEKLSGKTIVFIFTDGSFTFGATKLYPEKAARELAEKYDVCFYVVSSATGAKNIKVVEDIAAVNPCSQIVPFPAFYKTPMLGVGPLYVVASTVKIKTVTEEKIVGIVTSDINFKFDGVDVQPDHEESLNKLGGFLNAEPDTFAILAGFTDNAGDDAYNVKLSRMRTQSVKNYLLENSRIDPDRVIMYWYGPLNPVASNDTSDGRQQNRRVEIAVGKY